MKKKSLLLSSICTIMLCLSIVVGSTYALFTSESKVNIAITSGKVDVQASVASATLYSPTSIDMNTYAAVYDSGIELDVPEDGTLELSYLAPGDKVIVNLKLENESTVDYLYRVSIAQKETSSDEEFYNNLLVGVDGTYYSEFVSQWKSGSSMNPTVEVEITLPAYLSNEFQDRNCELVFKVEAIQGNAITTNEVAKRAYPVYSQADLNEALDVINDGDTIVLMQKFDAEIVKEGELSFNIRGGDVGSVKVDAASSSINYYVEETNSLDVSAVDSNSLHIFGWVKSLELNQGRVVVENSALVEKANLAPIAEQVANLVVNENSNVKLIVVNASDETAMAKVDVKENAVVKMVDIQNSANNIELTYNEGAIEQIKKQGMIINDIFTGDALIEALKAGGKVMLAADIELNKNFTINNDVELDLNGHTLTQNASSYCTISSGATLSVTNGNYIFNLTSSSSSAKCFSVSGTFVLSNVNLESNLISTRTSSSQSFYSFNGNNNSLINLTDTSVVCQVESKVKENCVITTYGISGGISTVKGGSITADNVINLGSSNASATLADVNINYAEYGINMRFGGGVVIKSSVTFSGELSKPAIIASSKSQIDESESGYEWELIDTISDCSSSNPIIECYQSGNIIKHVYTDERAAHIYGEYEYDERWGYIHCCLICGNKDYSNSISAGSSEEFYYPVKDENSLTNAALNATNYIKLENDIAITSIYFCRLLDGCVLDLNGYTITVNGNVYFNIEGNNVTIKNGKIRRPSNMDYSYGLKIDGGNVTVDGINIDSGINVSNGATATVKNCEITLSGTQSYYHVCAQVNSNAVVENCAMIRTNPGKANNYFWVESGSSMSVTGCTFESNCGTTYYSAGSVAPTFDFDIEG